VDFVQREDSGVLPAMGAIAATGTSVAAAEFLGSTDAKLCRMNARVRQLGRCFLNGEQVPRQRRPYKRRVSRNRTAAMDGKRVVPVTRTLSDLRIKLCKGGDDLDQTFAGAALSESTPQGSLTVGG
jgi:hypothetical protein